MTAWAQTIYIIRHAEKQPSSGESIPPALRSIPEYQPPTNGVDAAGNETPGTTTPGGNTYKPITDSLIPRGWERAGALAVLFGRMPAIGGGFKQPNSIVAGAYPAVDSEGSGSLDRELTLEHRPYQTVLPLAERLNVEVEATCQVGDEEAAMQLVLHTAGTVLVCWEHDHIFQPGPPATGLVTYITPHHPTQWPTSSWPGDRFDLVWHFELVAGTTAYTWTQEYQDLLLGDTSGVGSLGQSTT